MIHDRSEIVAETMKVVAPMATGATYGGSATAVIGGLTANEFAAFGGLLIAFIGLIVNIWFKHKHLQIARKRAQKDLEC